MRIGRWIRATIVALALGLVLVGLIRAGAFRAEIVYYRDAGGNLVLVATPTTPFSWTGVNATSETSTTITITVARIGPPPAWFRYDVAELPVFLDQPLGERTVVDGATGLVVPRLVTPAVR